MMVDVQAIRDLVEKKHPEAASGGSTRPTPRFHDQPLTKNDK